MLLFRRTMWAASSNIVAVRGFMERLPAFLLEKQVYLEQQTIYCVKEDGPISISNQLISLFV